MDRNNGGDLLAPPRPPKPQQPRVHQHSSSSSSSQSSNSNSLHHRPRAPEPLPNIMSEGQPTEELLSRSSSSASSIRRQPPPRPPTTQPQQQPEPVLPLPPRIPKLPLKPTVLHATSTTSAAVESATASHAPTIAPLVPLQQQQQQQQSSITFGRRSRASPVQPSSSSLSSPSALTIPQQPRGGSSPSPSPNRSFNAILAPSGAPAGIVGQSPSAAPIISTLTRNITNLSSNLISNLVNNHSSSGPAATAEAVTLAVPRPENERLTNEYVDTPFIQQQQQRQGGVGAGLAASGHHPHHLPHSQQHSTTTPHHHLLASRTHGGVVTSQPTAAGHGPTARLLSDSTSLIATAASPLGARKLLGRHASDAGGQVITKQPAMGGQKDLDATATALHSIDKLDRAELSAHLIDGGVMGVGGGGGSHLMGDALSAGGGVGLGSTTPSITCPQCEKCRCEGCQKPRQLPSRWLCGKTCFCSAETVLDYATCLCCVKALFYHCSKDHEIDNENGNSISCADDPCSCLPHKRAARWSCLGALSLCLPCLVCYWPMRGAISLCATCYANHSRQGCRCNAKKGRSKQQQLQMQQQPALERAIIGRGSGGLVSGGGSGTPGGAKKIFPVDHHHHHHNGNHKAMLEPHSHNKKKLEGGKLDCDSETRLGRTTILRGEGDDGGEEDRLTRHEDGRLSGRGGGGVVVVGGLINGGAAADSDSSSSGGGHLVRTLRLKPTSTSSTSSSQLSLLRHPADETPPRHLLD